MYELKEGADMCAVGGVKLAEATQKELKAMYESGDTRYIIKKASKSKKDNEKESSK